MFIFCKKYFHKVLVCNCDPQKTSENKLLKYEPPPSILCLHLTYEFTLAFLVSSLISILNCEKVLVLLKRTIFEFMLLKHIVLYEVCFFYSPALLYRGYERGLKIIFNNIFRNLVALDKKHPWQHIKCLTI